VPSRFAAVQHGVVGREQLVAAGMSASAIDRAIATGRLIRLHRGVYAVGHASLLPDGHRLAAVLAAGPGAVLSHTSAADAWGLLVDARARTDVTAPRARGRTLPRISLHRTRLHPTDQTVLNGIPITTVARTLMDVAATRPTRILERALERSEELRLFDLLEVDDCLERNEGQRGAGRLRTAVADARPADPRKIRSWLERAVLKLIDEHGLPRPAVNLDLVGWEVDLHWPEHRVAVELDGWGAHRTRARFEHDHARDLQLEASGWRVVRISYRQFRDDRETVAAALRAVLLRTAGIFGK